LTDFFQIVVKTFRQGGLFPTCKSQKSESPFLGITKIAALTSKFSSEHHFSTAFG